MWRASDTWCIALCILANESLCFKWKKKKKYLKTLFQSLCGQHRTDCFNFIQIHGKIFTWSKYLHGEFNIKNLFIRGATEQGALSSIGKEVDENKHRYKLYRISCSVKLPSKRKTNIQEELEEKKGQTSCGSFTGSNYTITRVTRER